MSNADEIKKAIKRVGKIMLLEDFKQRIERELEYIKCKAKFQNVFGTTLRIDPDDIVFSAPAILFYKIECQDRNYLAEIVIGSIYVRAGEYKKIVVYEHDVDVHEWTVRSIVGELAKLKAAIG